MPIDVSPRDFLQGFQLGSDAASRRTQLRAQEAAHRLRERQAAQEMELAAGLREQQKQIWSKQVSDEAAWKTAMGSFLMDIEPRTAPGGVGPTFPGMGISEATVKHLLPLAKDADDASRVLANAALLEQRQAQGQFLEMRPGLETEKLAIARERIASQERVAHDKIDSQEIIAQERSRLMSAQKAIDNAFAERRINNEEHRLSSQEVSQQLRDLALNISATEKGYRIDSGPATGGITGRTPALIPIARPPTDALVTQVQKSLLGTEKTLANLSDFDANVQAGHVGFRGVIGETFLDKLLPQFGFDTADAERMRSRGTLKTTIEGSLRQMTEDSRFSNEDRRDIKSLWPGVGVLESIEHTKQTTQLLRRVMAKRALIDARSINRDAPLFALDNYGKALADGISTGLLSFEDTRADLENSMRYDLLNAKQAEELFNRFVLPLVK